MRRALMILVFFSFFPLVLPGDVSGVTPCGNSSLTPPFVSSGSKPNILIILDNSNSFDEDFIGNAVGSYASTSKSVAARQALQKIVAELQSTANVGLMTFTLPSNVKSYYVHNSLPFASYNPASYCPNPDPTTYTTWPPAECQTYCVTGDPTAQGKCLSQLSTGGIKIFQPTLPINYSPYRAALMHLMKPREKERDIADSPIPRPKVGRSRQILQIQRFILISRIHTMTRRTRA